MFSLKLIHIQKIIFLFVAALVLSCPISYKLTDYLGDDFELSQKLDEKITFVEDFENGDLSVNQWGLNSSYYLVSFYSKSGFSGNFSPNGTQCLYIKHNNSIEDSSFAIEKTFDRIRPRRVSYYIATNSTSFISGNMALFDNTTPIVDIFFSYTGPDLFLYNGTDYSILSNYSKNSWYHIELNNINWDSKIFDLYIDGTFISTFNFENNFASSLTSIKFWNQNAWSEAYIDDITIE